MKNQITEKQKLKLTRLENELRDLWETLTPSERDRRSVFNKFFDLQKQINGIHKQNKILDKKEIRNEKSIR